MYTEIHKNLYLQIKQKKTSNTSDKKAWFISGVLPKNYF